MAKQRSIKALALQRVKEGKMSISSCGTNSVYIHHLLYSHFGLLYPSVGNLNVLTNDFYCNNFVHVSYSISSASLMLAYGSLCILYYRALYIFNNNCVTATYHWFSSPISFWMLSSPKKADSSIDLIFLFCKLCHITINAVISFAGIKIFKPKLLSTTWFKCEYC